MRRILQICRGCEFFDEYVFLEEKEPRYYCGKPIAEVGYSTKARYEGYNLPGLCPRELEHLVLGQEK